MTEGAAAAPCSDASRGDPPCPLVGPMRRAHRPTRRAVLPPCGGAARRRSPWGLEVDHHRVVVDGAAPARAAGVAAGVPPLVAVGLARGDPVAPREAVAAVLVRDAAAQGVPAPLQIRRDVALDHALAAALAALGVPFLLDTGYG